MSTYDLAKLCVFGLIALLGLVMVAIPKPCTKKEFRDDAEMVAKTRKSGFVTLICGIILVVLNVVI